jgi:hypothetical protein
VVPLSLTVAPFAELVLGALTTLGLFTRWTLAVGGLLIAALVSLAFSTVGTSSSRHHDGEAMPLTRHVERHFTVGETVRDIVIGMSDGLTVPFALAAGLSGAVESTSIVITAGLAEIAAGSIAMGLGGYLAARSDAEHYASERRR